MMALGIVKDMVDDGIIRDDAMNAVLGYKQITFQGKFNGIRETHQPAQRSELDFNITISHGLHAVPTDFKLVLPVRLNTATVTLSTLQNGYPSTVFLVIT